MVQQPVQDRGGEDLVARAELDAGKATERDPITKEATRTITEGDSLAVLGETIGETVTKALDAGGDAAEYAQQLQRAVVRVGETTTALWSTGDPAVALANSTVYLEAVGHVVVAWIWLEQLLAVGERDGAFYDGKRAAARYFFRFELPKTGPQFDLLASLDRTTLDVDPSVL